MESGTLPNYVTSHKLYCSDYWQFCAYFYLRVKRMDFYLEFLNDWLEFIWFLNDGCNDGCKASKTDLFLLQEHGFFF